jgi:hypothetical protein
VVSDSEPTPYRLAFDAEDGTRVAWVLTDTDVVMGLKVDEKRRLWILGRWFADEAHTPDEDLAEFLHDHATELDVQGFNVRRWWHLWACQECAAPPLLPCRSHRTGKAMGRCHRGRKPRGARP